MGQGARTLLGAPGRATRSKGMGQGARTTLLLLAVLLGARTLLGAPGLATRSKDATTRRGNLLTPSHMNLTHTHGTPLTHECKNLPHLENTMAHRFETNTFSPRLFLNLRYPIAIQSSTC